MNVVENMVIVMVGVIIVMTLGLMIACASVYGLFDRIKSERASLEKRIATLEARLSSFAALERLGIASQLGEEMIASVDTQVTTLEHEMQEKIDQLRATQRRTLEQMRVEMEQYRANMAGLAK